MNIPDIACLGFQGQKCPGNRLAVVHCITGCSCATFKCIECYTRWVRDQAKQGYTSWRCRQCGFKYDEGTSPIYRVIT